ncbi:MAG: DUF736 domain-containing protein [Sphingomonadales bacterium]|nr:DUF736 domain-containing protein [Sphingomonadales bacterium]
MTVIGQFEKQGDRYSGLITTRLFTAKVHIVPNPDKASEDAPDYRLITANGAEVGAAWAVTAKGSGQEYLNVKLADPHMPSPVYARLVRTRDGYALIWNA